MLRRVASHLAPPRPALLAAAVDTEQQDLALIHAVHARDLFRVSAAFDAAAAEKLDTVGHVVLPGLLTDEAVGRLIEALQHNKEIGRGHNEDMKKLRAEAEAAVATGRRIIKGRPPSTLAQSHL